MKYNVSNKSLIYLLLMASSWEQRNLIALFSGIATIFDPVRHSGLSRNRNPADS
jgi:hypothetical protein